MDSLHRNQLCFDYQFQPKLSLIGFLKNHSDFLQRTHFETERGRLHDNVAATDVPQRTSWFATARPWMLFGSAATTLMTRSANCLVRAFSSSVVIHLNLQLLLRRVIEGLLQVELLQFLDQRRIIGGIDDFFVLQKIDKAPLPDHF